MTTDQLTLVFAKSPRPSERERVLVEYLRGKGWVPSPVIEQALRWSDRMVRDTASESDLVISSPGIKGYKLLAESTMDEYHRYRSARRNQARLMLAKVIRTDRIYYSQRQGSIA